METPINRGHGQGGGDSGVAAFDRVSMGTTLRDMTFHDMLEHNEPIFSWHWDMETFQSQKRTAIDEQRLLGEQSGLLRSIVSGDITVESVPFKWFSFLTVNGLGTFDPVALMYTGFAAPEFDAIMLYECQDMLRLKAVVERHCHTCATPHARRSCSKCRSTRYCNRSCQMHDWESHKHQCPLPPYSHVPIVIYNCTET